MHSITNKLRPKDGFYITLNERTYLKKYVKQYPRVAMFDGVPHRKFYNHTGNSFIKIYRAPIHLRTEELFCIHNSVWSGHKGVSHTIAEFRKRFNFPNFTETLNDYIRKCLSCLQTKFSPIAAWRPPLQPMSSLQKFPADVLLIDVVRKSTPQPTLTYYREQTSSRNIYSQCLWW